MQPASLRHLFALDPSIIFLNHGSFGARPRAVLDAQDRIRREIEASPVEFLSRRSAALLREALVGLGAYLGASPDNLVFVANATTAVNSAGASLGLSKGDEVLAGDHEYGACSFAMERLCEARGASYRRFAIPLPYEGDESFLARLSAAIGPRTRTLFFSHITSATALRLPVEGICRLARERGLISIIDGAHAPAQVPLRLDELGADFYAGNCHKWLCAPLGSAFLYVRPELHASVSPPVSSWGMVAEAEGGHSHDGYVGSGSLARRLQWLGTRDLSPWLSVPAALEFLRRHDGSESRERCAALAWSCATRIADMFGGALPLLESQGLRMTLAPLPQCDSGALKSLLFDRYRIEAPIVAHAGSVYARLSFHCYNDESDATALIEALGELFPAGVAAPVISCTAFPREAAAS